VKFLALPLAAAAVAATPPIPFRSVAQQAPAGNDPAKPTVFVVTKPLQLKLFEEHLRPEDRVKARAVKLGERTLLAVFAGAKPTGGFAVAVKRLSLVAGRLTVAVEVREPSPDAMVIQAFTSPYQLVSVARSALPPKPARAWRLVDQQGRALASGTSYG
jgi:hypothetical protein